MLQASRYPLQSLPGASFVINGAVPQKDSALASAGAQSHLTAIGRRQLDGEFAPHA